jgi:hypothetical protein
MWVVALTVVMVALVMLFGHSAMKGIRRGVAAHYAEEAGVHMAKDEWPAAVQDLTLARRWDPEAPEVLRALADFLAKANGDVFALHHLLLRLEAAGHATIEDRLRIGEFQLTQGDVTRARATLASLPAEEREKRRAQELLANILRVEGRDAESEQVMRRALMSEPHDSSAQLRLALLDYQTPFAEIRARTRERLWGLAAGGDDAALQAIQFLSTESALSAPQADQLLTLVERHPHPTPVARYKVLSAQLRLSPERREAVLDREVAGFSLEAAHAGALLQWLLEEKEHDRLLKLTSAETATSSQTALEFRLKALAGAGRWKEVEEVLSESKELPLPPEKANLWRARAAHHIHDDPARTQHYLTAAYNAAGTGEKGEITLEAARFAEECGLWRMAGIGYKGIARAHPTAQIRMLEKAHEMAVRDRDGAGALESARYLAEQNPANLVFGRRLSYYQLITGQDMELAVQRALEEGGDELSHPADALVRALAAFRLGDLERVREYVAAVADVNGLTPGERAVLAGLIAVSGDVGAAYRLGEKVPPALLLEEEQSFLRRAL